MRHRGETPSRADRRRGYSIIEVCIAGALSAAVMGSVVGLLSAGQKSVNTGVTRTRLEGRAREALDRIVDELRSAKIQTFAGGAMTSHTASYQRRFGAYANNFDDFDLNSAQVKWAQLPVDVVRLDLAPGETANGQDDNGNGIADECQVSKVSGGVTTTLCSDVAPNGLTFDWVTTRTLQVTLVLTARDPDGNVLSTQASTQLCMRN
jgi:hypothetical protein